MRKHRPTLERPNGAPGKHRARRQHSTEEDQRERRLLAMQSKSSENQLISLTSKEAVHQRKGWNKPILERE
jgi:hypothetical protein